MGYSKEIYRLAYEQLEDIRQKNRRTATQRNQEIEEKLPAYAELSEKLHSLVANSMQQVLSGAVTAEDIKKEAAWLEQEQRKLLQKHGYPADYLEDIYDCSICRDTGFVGAQQCSCLSRILKSAAYHQNHIRYILDTQDLKDFSLRYYDKHKKGKEYSPRENMERILTVSRYFMEHFDEAETKNLLFSGGTGLGKTFLSSCIAKELLQQERSVFYQTASKIVDVLEDYKFRRMEVSYDIESAMENIYHSDLLIIDDLGAEPVTTHSVASFFEIVNERLLTHKKMIINTNLNLQDLGRVYTSRLASRLIGSFYLCEFDGEDIRLLRATGGTGNL